MPAPEQKVVNCPCGAKLLLRWTWSIGSAIYRARCPDCSAEHQVQATPPIEVYRLDSEGQLGIPHNDRQDRQSADLTAGVRPPCPKCGPTIPSFNLIRVLAALKKLNI